MLNSKRMHTICTTLKNLRKERGITQEVAAGELSVTRKRYASWEEGRAEPDILMLYRISQLNNITLDEIVKQSLIEPANVSNHNTPAYA